VAIMSIFRDEADWLKEWIDYHEKVGVDHFYLYNNKSVDDYAAVLKPYIERGVVDVIEWDYDDFPACQLRAITNCISSVKRSVKWLALIDTDEFIVPKKVDSLKKFLKNYEDYAGVMVNWQLFGTSHVKSLKRSESLLKNLTWKFPTNFESTWNGNHFCKSIVRPDRVNENTENPKCGNHVFMPQKGWKMVNSKKKAQETCSSTAKIVIDDIQINHYWFRTEDWFYSHKIHRREGFGEQYPSSLIEWLFKMGHSEQDFSIQRFLP
jgi:hypothetical protein